MKNQPILFFTRLCTIILAALFFLQIPASAGQLAADELADHTVYLPLITKNYLDQPSGEGNVSGIVKDARSGIPLENAEVCYLNICDETNGDGEYSLVNIPSGEQKISAELLPNYRRREKFVNVIPNITVSLNFNLLPPIGNNEIRIELYWREEPTWGDGIPNDLNLHLWTDYSEPDHHIFIDHPGNCQDLDFQPFSCYENDEQNGTGPDTILLLNNGDNFKIGVLNQNYPRVPELINLYPTMQVFLGDNLIASYELESDVEGDGDLWYVFELRDGSPLEHNCLSFYPLEGDEPPPDCP